MDMNQYDEDFVKKYHDDAEGTNYLYEYKTGEFQGGEIVGMQSIPQTCSGTTYHYDKDNGEAWIQHSQLGSFIGEEYYYETDLQYPICDNC
jgi:hypothetical protein